MHVRYVRKLLGVTAFLGLSVLSCSDDPTGLGAGVPASLAAVSGTNQTGVVNTELAEPLVVEVLNVDGVPLPDIVVNFVVVAGGGSMFAGVAETNNQGRAIDYWRLGTSTTDSQRVEVRLVNRRAEKRVFGVFTATALPGPVASIVIPHDTIRLTWVGDTTKLPVSLFDAFGNAVPSAPVRWRLLGPAGVVALDSITGIATAVTAGSRRVGAFLGTINDTTRVAIEPVPANLEPVAETLTVNSLQLPVTPAVVAYDSGGVQMAAPGPVVWLSLNPGIAQVDSLTGTATGLKTGLARLQATSTVSGARDTVYLNVRQIVRSVTVSPPTNILGLGDSLKLTATAVDSNGVVIASANFGWNSFDTTVARVDSRGWVRGVAYGTANVRARSSGIGGLAGITVRSADTLSISIVSGNAQAGIVGTNLGEQLRILVHNQFGEGIPGIPVTWWGDRAGMGFSGSSATTDSAGVNAMVVTLDTVAGVQHVRATFGYDTTTFSLVARADVPAAFIYGGSFATQTDTVADHVPSRPRVRVVDQYGNGVPAVPITFLPRSGSTITGPATIRTGAEGRATVDAWVLDSIAGQDTLFASIGDTLDTSFDRLRFIANAAPDSASFLRSIMAIGPDTVRERDSVRVDVQLRDRFANPLTTSDGPLTLHTQSFGVFDPIVDPNDGTYRASFRPNGGRGLTRIYALLEGDTMTAVDSVFSRSYQLTWTGQSTDYLALGNWTHNGTPMGPPSQLDSLYIPTGVANYPLLAQNTTVENVLVQDGATLNVGSFDLTVTRNFLTTSLLGVSGLSGTGRLIMTGIGQINGDMRSLRVVESGRTSLEGNLNVTGGRIVVQGGRLRNERYRIRVRPN